MVLKISPRDKHKALPSQTVGWASRPSGVSSRPPRFLPISCSIDPDRP